MPIQSPPPIVHPYTPVPNPNQGRTVFNASMQQTFNRWPETSASQEAMGLWMEETANQTEQWAIDAAQAVTDATAAGSEQVGLAAAQVSAATTQAGLAATSANEAEIARNMAFSVANIAGDWPSMTGPLAQFEAVYNSNNSKIWVAKVAIPDITAVQPTTDDANWLDYFSAISAGEVVSGPSDTADAKLPNLAWLKSRGLGDKSVLTGADLNAADLPTGFYVIISPVNGPVADAGYLFVQRNTSTSNTMEFQEVSPPHGKYQKSKNSGANGSWKPLDNPDVLPPENGGTGQTTLAAAREAMEAAKRGAITGSELTMTANRVAGRLSTNGAVQELTGAQLLTLAGGAAAGRVADTGITSATARLMGRVAAGTGAVAELPANDVLTFLGIATTSVTQAGAVSWVAAGAVIRLVKISGFVIACFDFDSGSTATGTASWTASIPSGFRPSSTFSGGFIGANASAPFGDVDQCTVLVTTAGAVSTDRQSNGNGFLFSQTVIWAV